jgi:hypothetical protein
MTEQNPFMAAQQAAAQAQQAPQGYAGQNAPAQFAPQGAPAQDPAQAQFFGQAPQGQPAQAPQGFAPQGAPAQDPAQFAQQGFQPQAAQVGQQVNPGFAPAQDPAQAQGFAPQAQQYAPPAQGFAPQGQPQTIPAQGFQPQAAPQGYAQPETAAQPQGFAPAQQAPQGFQPQAQPAAPDFQKPAAQNAPIAQPSGAPTTDPFASPAGVGGHSLKDDLGAAVLVRPESFTKDMQTSSGLSDVIRCDWAVLDGPNAGQLRANSLIFNKGAVRDLNKVLNGTQKFLVGRVAMGVAKTGQSAPVIFNDAPESIDAARHAAAQLGWV